MAGQKCDGGTRTRIMRAHRPKQADAEVSYQQYHADVLENPLPAPPRHERRVDTEDLPSEKPPTWFTSHSKHIGAGMILMAVLFWSGTTYVIPFFTSVNERWDYGQAKLSYYHLNVGHNGASDFLTEYLRGKVIVIEMPGGDVQKTRIYSYPIGNADDHSIHLVRLEVQRLNAQGKPDKPDLIVSVEGFDIGISLYNTGDGFKAGGGQ